MILAAFAATWGTVSSRTPAGAWAKASWVGSAAWQATQWVFIRARISASVGGAGTCAKLAVEAVMAAIRTVAATRILWGQPARVAPTLRWMKQQGILGLR